MASEPPAPDLGAIRARWERSALRPGEPAYTRASADIPALLEIIDAQAARLAAVEQARDDFTTSTYELLGELLAAHQIALEPCLGGPCVANALLAIGHALTAAEAERDQQTALVCRWDERDHEKTVQLARLAALEAAARQLAGHHGPVHCNCQTCKQFRDAVAALDAPPGESP